MTCFRMYTKSQDIIYVRTHTHMVVDMWTSKPRYIVSINEVLPWVFVEIYDSNGLIYILLNPIKALSGYWSKTPPPKIGPFWALIGDLLFHKENMELGFSNNSDFMTTCKVSTVVGTRSTPNSSQFKKKIEIKCTREFSFFFQDHFFD